MSEPITTQDPEAESAPVTIEAIQALLTKREEASEARLKEEVEAQIEALRAPDRTNVPDYVNRHGEPVAKVRNVSERRYARLPEEEKLWRDDESDHWAAQWIKANSFGNREQKSEASDKLDGYYGRATTLEGTAPLTGALSDGTGAGLLPIPLAELVMIARDNRSVARRLFRIFPMSEQTRRITTVGAITGAMVAEDATASQGEPTIATKVLVAKKAQVVCKASIEELNDSAFDVVSIWTERSGTGLGALLDTQVATSNGTPPNIQEALSGTNYAEATSTVLIYEDLVGQQLAVSEAYRAQGVYLASAASIEFLSILMDGNDRPQVLASGAVPQTVSDVGGTGMLLGKPVVEFPLASGTIWFGDPRAAYGVGDRQSIVVASSEHVDFASDRVVWKFTERFDGVNLDASASNQIAGILSVA